ncbi:MAG: ABC-F family ATP-binding cassette domain-containing protein [Bdellovibrionales bacterium]|nr:ABC-F family ATP-binding cassette domain-containing protein [Bdellovibrionales bacterium]
MQSSIRVSNVSYELPNGRFLFNNISFSLTKNITALVGPNGIGKTTLAQLLKGELLPKTGSITKFSSVTLLSQWDEPVDMTVEEYLINNYSWSLLGEKLIAGISKSNCCTQLSGGQWMRLRLANMMKDQFMILDEPTNDLDREAKLILLDFLKNNHQGILLISHDREFLELSEFVIELSSQGLRKYGGGWRSYEEEKKRERNQLSNSLLKAKKERDVAKNQRIIEIQKQEKRNRRGKVSALKGGIPKILVGARKRKAQGTTGKIDVFTMKQANEGVRAAYEAFSEMKIDPKMYINLSGVEVPNNKTVIEAKDFNIFYKNWIYKKDLNFLWKGNFRLVIKGNNGSGKSSLLKVIMGSSLKTKGDLRVADLTKIYIDQNSSNLDETKSIIENVCQKSLKSEDEVRGDLAKFLFKGDSVFQKVNSLSGGERLRAALACGLLQSEKPELLILDEPTNNLDLENINFLENLISQFKGAIVMTSHDEIFLENCQINQELCL